VTEIDRDRRRRRRDQHQHVDGKSGRCATSRQYRDLFMNGVTVTSTAGGEKLRVARRFNGVPV